MDLPPDLLVHLMTMRSGSVDEHCVLRFQRLTDVHTPQTTDDAPWASPEPGNADTCRTVQGACHHRIAFVYHNDNAPASPHQISEHAISEGTYNALVGLMRRYKTKTWPARSLFSHPEKTACLRSKTKTSKRAD